MTLATEHMEWLETDGLGGFASGTAGLVRTRRYHALLLTATTPPTGRLVLVSGFDARVETAAGARALSAQRYVPNVQSPDGEQYIRQFSAEPWPTWTFDLPGGGCLTQEILVQHGTGTVLVRWSQTADAAPVTLRIRPLYAGRDYHSLMHENPAFNFEVERRDGAVAVRPYGGVPMVVSWITGRYEHDPVWYRQFEYDHERARGLDAVEDLASPGAFVFHLGAGQSASWMLRAAPDGPVAPIAGDEVAAAADALLEGERERRARFATPLDRAADAYLVRRRSGRTVVAGYPWFTDWGRDTFIALRGVCLATGRLVEARDILIEWADAVSEGMLPNRFPDHGEAAEFNAVDASLWYVVAVHDFLAQTAGCADLVTPVQLQTLSRAVLRIVDGYAAGTRFGIRMDDDGLLAAGEPGVQLTWMDARVGDRVITPRTGKAVEVQALWVNALAVAARWDPRRTEDQQRAMASFADRFWNAEAGCLYDVVDVDHVRGTVDGALRPNQILAVGGLPLALIRGERARQVVDAVERALLTPMGLRSLAPAEAGYAPRYTGDAATRDAVYHQGTVWPWLIGPFAEAWIRVRRCTPSSKRHARARFLMPLLAHLQEAGLGHVSEVADAESPHAPRGCPFQAWSLGELLRLDRQVLAQSVPPRRPSSQRPERSRGLTAASYTP